MEEYCVYTKLILQREIAKVEKKRQLIFSLMTIRLNMEKSWYTIIIIISIHVSNYYY